MTCVDFGFIMHVRGGEGLAFKFGNPIMELVVTCRDQASIIAVKGVSYVEFRAISIAIFT